MFRRRDEEENEYSVQPVNKNFSNNQPSGFPAANYQPAAANQAMVSPQVAAQNSFLEDAPQQTAVPFIKTNSSNSSAPATTPSAPVTNSSENFTPKAEAIAKPAQPEFKPSPKSASTINSFVPSALRASSPPTPEPKPSTTSQIPNFTPKATVTKNELNIGLETERRLTVGYGISLEGRVSDCDKLVIYGNVNAELNNVKALQISDSGCFRGAAEIDYAEISGVFEGELKIRKNIVINSTGRVSGKITYGSIEIKPGGKFTGEIVEDKALVDAAQNSENSETANQDDFNLFGADQKTENRAA